jgi:fructooligosaccharide transport system substrate-binding protein
VGRNAPLAAWRSRSLVTLVSLGLLTTACAGATNPGSPTGGSVAVEPTAAGEPSSSAEQSSAGGAPVTISLVANGEPRYAGWVKAFNATHPGIQVKLEDSGASGGAANVAALRFGQKDPTLDITSDEVGFDIQWFTKGWIDPLDTYFSAEELKAFVPSRLADETYQGHFLGVPVTNSTLMLGLNLDLFKQAGVEPPPGMKETGVDAVANGAWTWEKVAEVAKTIQEKTGMPGLQFPKGEMWVMYPLGEQLGGNVTSPDGLTVKGFLDGPAWLQLAKWFQDVHASGAATVMNPEWGYEEFTAGKVAMVELVAEQNTICLTVKFECDVAAEPHFQGVQPKSARGSNALVLSAFSQHKKEAAEFLRWVALDPAAWKIFEEDTLPSQDAPVTKTLTDPAYDKFPASVKRLAAYQQLNWPADQPKSPADPEIWRVWDEVWLDIQTGAKTPAEGIQELTERADEALNIYR